MEKKSLIILGGSVLELPLLIKAKERGYFIYLVDIDQEAIGASVADRTINLSTRDVESIKRYIDALDTEETGCIVGVGAVDTDVNKTIAALSSSLNLRHFNYTLSDLVANKYKLYTLLKAYKDKGFFTGFELIDTKICWFYDELKGNLPKGAFILKPTENMGGLGVIKTDEGSLYNSFVYAKKHSPNGELIAQPFIPGDIYKAQFLIGEREVIISNIWKVTNTDSSYQIERSRTDRLPPGVSQEILDSAEEVIRRMGIKYSPCEIKFIRNGSRLYFLDINLRLEGGFFVDTAYHSYLGYDLLDNYLAILTGGEPKPFVSRQVFIANGRDHLYAVKVYAQERFSTGETGVESFQVKRDFPQVPSSKYYSRLLYARKNIFKKIRLQTLSVPEERSAEKSIQLAAIKNLAGKCKVCKVCDGRGCLGEMPGFGGVQQNEAFIANYEELRAEPLSVELLARRRNEIRQSLFGFDVRFPLLIAPISGVDSNLGGMLDEHDFYISLLKGSRGWGTLAFIGDGSKNDKYLFMSGILAEAGYEGIITLKPRLPLDFMLEKIDYFNETDVPAICIDIDSITLPTLKKSDVTVGRYTIAEIAALRRRSKKVIIIKGVTDFYDAIRLADIGIDSILVSNHGGRSLSSLSSSFSILKSFDISYLKKRNYGLLIGFDGGIRNGEDIVKPLLCGADYVCSGRPFAIYAAGGGEKGVMLLLDKWYQQYRNTIKLLGIAE